MTLTIIIAAAAFLAGYGACAVRSRPSSQRLLEAPGGIHLPSVSDPRWRRTTVYEDGQDEPINRLVIGKIRVDEDGCVYAGETLIDAPARAMRKYARAVFRAHQQRLSLAAIDSGIEASL